MTPTDPELLPVSSHGRSLRIGVAAVGLLLILAIVKPWPNAAAGPRSGSGASGSPLPATTQLVAGAAAASSAEPFPTTGPTPLCENPDAWRVVAEDVEFGQHVRTWVIATVAYSSTQPELASVPVTAVVSSGVESLGFCAPAAAASLATAGWSGTIWRVGASAPDPSQWQLVGRMTAPAGSLGGFSQPIDPTAVFWAPGRYVLEAKFGGSGPPAWLGVLIQSSF